MLNASYLEYFTLNNYGDGLFHVFGTKDGSDPIKAVYRDRESVSIKYVGVRGSGRSASYIIKVWNHDTLTDDTCYGITYFKVNGMSLKKYLLDECKKMASNV